MQTQLLPEDLNYIVNGLPKEIRALMMQFRNVVLAGGAIRASIAGEAVSDYDFWIPSFEAAEMLSNWLVDKRKKDHPNAYAFGTDNAFTIITQGRTPVQFIHRWTFEEPMQVCPSFDFSIAAAAIWYDVDTCTWHSNCHEFFYADLAAKRLRYLSPVRNEDAGGSFLRMSKFLRRGYKISPESMGKLMARLNQGIKYDDFLAKPEDWQGTVYTSLLREVDPLLIIDGVEAVEGNDGKFRQRPGGEGGC